MKNRAWTIHLEDDSPYYEVIKYPAGEIQVRIRPKYHDYVKDSTVRIVSRRTDGDGLLLLALLVSALRGLSIDISIELVIPYLPFGRADRAFVPGDCCGLATYLGLIQAMEFDRVITLDAHNSAAFLNQLDNGVDIKATLTIVQAIDRWAKRHRLTEVTVLFPDKGALERYGDVPDAIGPYTIKKLYAEKQRDPATGKLSGFKVKIDTKAPPSHILIVDDICDGGGTFLGLAGELPGVTLGLYVTHGIFSQGFEKLHKAFDIIYTTDSVKDVSTLDAAVFDAELACNMRSS